MAKIDNKCSHLAQIIQKYGTKSQKSKIREYVQELILQIAQESHFLTNIAESFLLHFDDFPDNSQQDYDKIYEQVLKIMTPDSDKIFAFPYIFLKSKLGELGERDLKEVLGQFGSFWHNGYFDELSGFELPTEIDIKNPEILKHYTSSFALPNIIQMGGLCSSDLLIQSNIPKDRTGEDYRTEKGYTSSEISFWKVSLEAQKQEYFVGNGSDEIVFPSFPMLFVIEKMALRKLNLSNGTMSGERTVSDFVPLELVSKIFVPTTEVQKVAQILAFNNYQIEVLPTNF